MGKLKDFKAVIVDRVKDSIASGSLNYIIKFQVGNRKQIDIINETPAIVVTIGPGELIKNDINQFSYNLNAVISAKISKLPDAEDVELDPRTNKDITEVIEDVINSVFYDCDLGTVLDVPPEIYHDTEDIEDNFIKAMITVKGKSKAFLPGSL